MSRRRNDCVTDRGFLARPAFRHRSETAQAREGYYCPAAIYSGKTVVRIRARGQLIDLIAQRSTSQILNSPLHPFRYHLDSTNSQTDSYHP